MKKNWTFSAYFLLLTLASFKSILAQTTYVVPNFRIEKPEDCPAYNLEIQKATAWILATPWNEQQEEKKHIFKQFIFPWVNFSPDVHVEIYGYVIDIFRKNPDFWIPYTCAWIQAELAQPLPKPVKTPISFAQTQIYHEKALQIVIEIYQKSKVNPDEKIDFLVELAKKNKLNTWITENWNK
ncbi:MAG: hypothetical protein NZ551_08345 [Microscillaceae bacterium]|nr:hypothetical protein [Microscillaceae bacterium]MDW8461208.1 hypothetical protein [Cytophagales bacterium]